MCVGPWYEQSSWKRSCILILLHCTQLDYIFLHNPLHKVIWAAPEKRRSSTMHLDAQHSSTTHCTGQSDMSSSGKRTCILILRIVYNCTTLNYILLHFTTLDYTMHDTKWYEQLREEELHLDTHNRTHLYYIGLLWTTQCMVQCYMHLDTHNCTQSAYIVLHFTTFDYTKHGTKWYEKLWRRTEM